MDQEEHGVHPESQRQEGDNLRAGGVEVDPQQRGEAHAGTDVERDQENSAQAETSLRSDSVRPSVQAANSVHNLNIFGIAIKCFLVQK